MAKRGRPKKDDAKRDNLHLRLSSEEVEMLSELTDKTGRTRTDLLMEFVREKYNDVCK